MKSEKQKMLSGEFYSIFDEELMIERERTQLLLKDFNDLREDDIIKRDKILNDLLPLAGDNLWVKPPFYCDYGTNIITGEGVFFNYNCVLLDVMPIKIGSRTTFGPNVQIYTAIHPLDFKKRASGLEYAKSINIGQDVCIEGGVIICPGVRIGDKTIIAAGSVVTKNIPSNVFAAGNPCKVIRKLV